MVIITGVGRSGTTILGQIFESFQNTYVIYEPVAAKCLIPMPAMFRTVLMEDHFIPAFNKIMRRRDIVKAIRDENPLFVLKTLESQPWLIPESKLVSCPIVHAVRNGWDVIGSSMKRGWYTDEYLENDLLDYVIRYENCKIPWYMPERFFELFKKSNQANRIALVWAVLVQMGIDHATWSYEVLMADPEASILNLSEWAKTPIEDKTIFKAIDQHKPPYEKQSLDPEVAQVFESAMRTFGYEL